MSHSLCVMGVYDEVKMTVPMIVRYVHNDKYEKRNKRHITPGPTDNRKGPINGWKQLSDLLRTKNRRIGPPTCQ
jgi:hypothetical protein